MNLASSFPKSYTSALVNGRKHASNNFQSFQWFNRSKTYKKNNLIYLYDEPLHQIYGLHNGYVKLGYYAEEGKEVIFSILKPGDIFGNLTMESTHSADFAQALTEVEVSILDEAYYKRIIRQHPELVPTFLQSMSQRVNFLEHQLVAAALWDVEQRILTFLYFFARNFCHIDDQKAQAQNFLTHYDIASINLTTRQTVSVTMARLRYMKVIDYDRKHITIYLDRLNDYLLSLND